MLYWSHVEWSVNHQQYCNCVDGKGEMVDDDFCLIATRSPLWIGPHLVRLRVYLCGICMFSLYLCGFSVGPCFSSHSPKPCMFGPIEDCKRSAPAPVTVLHFKAHKVMYGWMFFCHFFNYQSFMSFSEVFPVALGVTIILLAFEKKNWVSTVSDHI